MIRRKKGKKIIQKKCSARTVSSLSCHGSTKTIKNRKGTLAKDTGDSEGRQDETKRKRKYR